MILFGKKDKKSNDKDNGKIKMVEVSQLRFDRDFKNVFQQENDKVTEIAKKADAALLEKIQTGAVSINKAYELIKAAEARKKAGEVVVEEESVSNTGKGINQDSFKLGVLFVLSELEKGRKKGQILKDKRIAKLELGELNLSEEEMTRISRRFGIA